MAADFGILRRFQDREPRHKAIENVAPGTSPPARIGGSSSVGDLSLLGSRAARGNNVPPFPSDLAPIYASTSPLADRPNPLRHVEAALPQNGVEHSFVSPFVDKTVPRRRNPDNILAVDGQRNNVNPLDTFSGSSDSGYEIESTHVTGLVLSQSGKRGTVRNRDIYSCGYHLCSEKFSRKSAYDHHLQTHPTHAALAFPKYVTGYLTGRELNSHGQTLDEYLRSGNSSAFSKPGTTGAIMAGFPSGVLNQQSPGSVGANRRKSHTDGLGQVVTRALFIGNLSTDANGHTLRSFFESYGDNLIVWVPIDFETGKTKGFGYITFNSIDNAVAAFNKTQGTYLKGRKLHLEFSNHDVAPQRRRPCIRRLETESFWSSHSSDEDENIPSVGIVPGGFVELPATVGDQRYLMRCFYCNYTTTKNHSSRRQQHLLECRKYQRAIQNNLRWSASKCVHVQPEHPSQIFMHYTIAEDRCGDNEAVKSAILARLAARGEAKPS